MYYIDDELKSIAACLHPKQKLWFRGRSLDSVEMSVENMQALVEQGLDVRFLEIIQKWK